MPDSCRSGALTPTVLVLLALLTSACARSAAQESNELTVIGLDYAFAGPDTLPAGPTVIGFENRGEVPHEMILVRFKDGATMEQAFEAERTGGDPMEFMDGGAAILIAGPHETAGGRILVDLAPGRTYALICAFRDEPDAPEHTELGMVSSFYVR